LFEDEKRIEKQQLDYRRTSSGKTIKGNSIFENEGASAGQETGYDLEWEKSHKKERGKGGGKFRMADTRKNF